MEPLIAGRTSGTRPQVLVIEDDPGFRGIVLELLDSHGFDTVGAPGGLEGVELARTLRPDLILCDIYMEGMDGYAALRALRERTDTATIPFVFLTAEQNPAGLRKAMISGADDYLIKPVEPDTLVATIRARLAKLDAQRRHNAETNARLLALFDATPDLVCLADEEDRHLFHLNRAGRRFLNIGEQFDVGSLELQNLFSRPGWAHFLEVALPAARRDGSWSGETALQTLDAIEVSVTLALVAHPAGPGMPAYLSLVAREFAESRRLQAELTYERDLLGAVMDSVRERILFKDLDGRYVRLNRAASDRLGLSNAMTAVGKTDADFLAERPAERHRALEKELVEQNLAEVQDELLELRRNGGASWSRVAKQPFRDRDGRVVGTITFASDVTAPEQALQALDRSEALLQLLLESAADFVALVEQGGNIRFHSASYQKILGLGPAELQSLRLAGTVHRADRERFEEKLREAFAGAEDAEFEGTFQSRDGQGVPVRCRFLPVRGDAGWVGSVLLVARDISARRRAEQELLAGRRETDSLLSSLSAVLIGVDPAGRIARWNAAASTAFNLTAEEAVGRNFFESALPWDWDVVRKGVTESLVRREPLDLGEVKVPRAGGGDGWLHLNVSPCRGEGASGLHYIVVGLDITQRRQLEDRIRELERHEPQGQPARGLEPKPSGTG